MKMSAVKPYEGKDPYIFVSYCHKDRRFVLPFIETLARDGYRIWYDEGINPGSEWCEIIADHMARCNLCIGFISENAAASHNCRREISYTLLKSKPLLSVFLEETMLTPGMEMQLTAYQCVFIYKYIDIESCLKVIESIPECKQCLGTPNPSIVVRSPSFYDDDERFDGKNTIGVEDEWFGINKKAVSNVSSFSLLRKATGDNIMIDNDCLYLGRPTENSHNSYDISNGNLEISRKHFMIFRQGDKYFVQDCRSKNGTFHNGKPLMPDKPSELSVGDEIRASTEIFVFNNNLQGGD